MNAMPPHYRKLPRVLPEPYYYLSSSQSQVIRNHLPALLEYVPLLPVWVTHRRIADALGFSSEGIERALEHTGRPYLWATEFENVHSFWNFNEPPIVVDGTPYKCVETYYHAQKPCPFDCDLWDSKRVEVMRRGLAEKFQNPELKELLRSTHTHPLVSIKPDSYWGFDPLIGGKNMLGYLLEEIRRSSQS